MVLSKLWLAALLLAASAAQAASPPAPPPRAAAQPNLVDPMANDAAALAPAGDTASQVAFAYADRDADALVTWEEYRNRGMRLFYHVDTNGDFVMQISELQALGGPDAPKAPYDVNIATFNAALRKQFDAGDTNGDGALTPLEWSAILRPSKLF